MTQDEIIEMARQAGFHEYSFESQTEQFNRFAKLVTEKQQRTWVGLTDAEIDQGLLRTPYTITAEAWREGVRWAYHKLKEKNT